MSVKSFCSVVGKLYEIYKDNPDIVPFLMRLRGLVKIHRADPSELYDAIHIQLQDQMEKLRESNEILTSHNARGDASLGELLNAAASELCPGSHERRYVTRRGCGSLTPKFGKKEGKSCNYIHVDQPRVSRYIMDHEFINGDWREALIDEQALNYSDRVKCPTCKGDLSIWSTANILIPESPLVAAFVTRQKTDGRSNTKLTEVIAFDERFEDRSLMRNLNDGNGKAVIVKNVDKDIASRRVAKEFINQNMDRKFLRHLGVKLNSKISVTAELHYAMFCWMKNRFFASKGGVLKNGFDDHVVNGAARWNNAISKNEYLHHLRARAKFQGRHIELCLKPESVYEAEANPKSALFHVSYAVKERQRQEREWTPAHIIVFSILNETLRRGLNQE